MDVEKAKSALMNAHAAGDVEAAKKIANFLKSSQAQEAPKQEKAPLLNRAANIGAAYIDARSFGLGPKVAAGVGSAIAKPLLETGEAVNNLFGGSYEAPELAELYRAGVDKYSGFGKKAFEDDAALAIAATLAGGLKTGKQLAATKAGQASANWAGRGALGGRIVKGGALGAAGGALAGAGASEVGDELSGAGKGAAFGFGLGSAVPAIGGAIGKLNTKTFVPTSEQIRQKGGELFKLAEQKGGVLKPEIADEFFDKVLSVRPQTEAGKVFKGSSPVTNILDNVESLKGKPLTLDAAKEVDEALGDLAYSTMDKFGKLNSDGKKFLDMQTALRRTIENADEAQVIGGKEGFEAVKEARKLWATSLRLRDIEKIIDNAERMDQPSNAIRVGFRNLLRNADRLKGYSPQEVKAIEKAAKTGIVTDFFRLGGSGLVPIGTGVTGLAAGPVGGAAGAAGGYALQQGSKAIAGARQMSRAQEAAKTIAERSGMVTQEQRLPLPTLRQILQMSPAEAKKLSTRDIVKPK